MSTITRGGPTSDLAANVADQPRRLKGQPDAVERDSRRRRDEAAAVLVKVAGLTTHQRGELMEEKLSPLLPGAVDEARTRAREGMTTVAYSELATDVRGALRPIGLAEYPWANRVLFDAAVSVAAKNVLTAHERQLLNDAWVCVLSAR